jgi:4-hydroxybenzoate polyprenyltransferase
MTVGELSTRPGPLRTFRLALTETRPGVQLLYAIRFLTGAALGILTSNGSVRPSLVIGLAAWTLGTMAVYLVNGVMDVSEDRVNGSRRPIASGALGVSSARLIVAGLALLSLVLSLLLPLRATLMVLALLLLGWFYSGPPLFAKRHPVGASASLILTGLAAYAAGYFSAGGGRPSQEVIILALAMSLGMGLVGVPVKDLSDVEGDRLAGRRSWPVMWGESGARLAICCVALAGAAVFLVSAIVWAPAMIAAAVVTAIGFAVIAVVVMTPLSHGPRSSRRRAYRIFMVTAYCAHLAAVLGAALS